MLRSFVRNAMAKDEGLSSDTQDRTFGVASLASGVLNTARAVVDRCGAKDIDSGYVLARTLVERSINFAYLAVCPDSEYQRWLAHGRQKGYRLLDRTKSAGSQVFRIGLTDLPPSDAIPGLTDDLRTFTSARGGENTRWTDVKLDDRLGAIENTIDHADRAVLFLLMASTHCYEIGAEAQHGTFFGVGFRHGLMQGPREDVDSHVGLLMLSAVLCVYSCLIVMAALVKDGDVYTEATRAFDKFGAVAEVFIERESP